MLPPVINHSVAHESVELTGGLFETVHAALEMTDLGRPVREAKGLPNGDMLLIGA
jgi:hypothetical protein